jgi:pyruvate/2-oxoglutarate dehydrogenase complex dihydrolipoamide dehydrogenase (E3) component
MEAEKFDVLVLGSGEAGKYIAWTLGAEGKRVGLIERRYIGGSCPNIACLPSKNVIHSAKVAWYARNLNAFGMKPAGAEIDMTVVRDRKRTMVAGLIDVHEKRFAASHVELIRGQGVFVAPRTLSVEPAAGGDRRLMTAETVIVSTGSRAVVPDIPGLREASPMTHVEQLELDRLPGHLVILGGGYIGLEFAQAMVRFGAKVTVLDQSARLLVREDEDVVTALAERLVSEGVQLRLGVTLDSVAGRSGDAVTLRVTGKDGPEEIEATHILAAAGRAPNTDAIGLEAAGIAVTGSGHIRVDASLRTGASGVYAVGDCAGSPHFTHIAFDDHRVVLRAIRGETSTTLGRQVPYTLFTDPELAHVGLHEHEARHQGISYRLAKLPMAAVLRARTLGETAGFLKALIGEDDRILGFTALGVGAGELLAPVQLAMVTGLPYTALAELVVTHPTLTEGLVYLFSSVPAK